MANVMKHDRIAGSRKTANLSRAAETGKLLSHYDVISKKFHHLNWKILRFQYLLDLQKYRIQKKLHMYLMSE